MELGEAIVAVALFFSGAAVFILRGPLGRALADRVAGKRLDDGRTAADEHVREVANQVEDELGGIRARMDELEERQDFTERLLAQQRHDKTLSGGS